MIMSKMRKTLRTKLRSAFSKPRRKKTMSAAMASPASQA
ncbi:hypothetical protein PS1_016263 [Malus domestica]